MLSGYYELLPHTLVNLQIYIIAPGNNCFTRQIKILTKENGQKFNNRTLIKIQNKHVSRFTQLNNEETSRMIKLVQTACEGEGVCSICKKNLSKRLVGYLQSWLMSYRALQHLG